MNKNIHKIVLLLVSTIGFSCSNNSIEIFERKENEKQKIYEMIAGINGKEWKLQEFHISGLDLVSDQYCYSDDTFLFGKRSIRDSLNVHFRFDYTVTQKKNNKKCGIPDDDYIIFSRVDYRYFN